MSKHQTVKTVDKQEMTMKTVLAALALTLGVLSASLPASADYTSPSASRLQQALTHGY